MDIALDIVFNKIVSVLEKHPQWPSVMKIHTQLTQAGYRSLVAGGAVRDLLLSVEPNDIDIATNATPEQVEELFEKTVMVGRQFGVSRVIIDGHDIEVATFRKDGEYKNGRSPESVTYSSEKEDALRRDFTINALFYDVDKKEVIDYVGGQSDLMQKMIKAVGDPHLRFEEDKLRILRAVRFSAQLNFHIESVTQAAIKKHVSGLHQVSMERVRDEWRKLLKSPWALQGMQKTYELKIWSMIFSDWNYKGNDYNNIWGRSSFDEETSWIIWFILHFSGRQEKMAKQGMNWKLPKDLIRKMVACDRVFTQLKNLHRMAPVDVAILLGDSNGQLAAEIYQTINRGKIKSDWAKRLEESQIFFKEDHKLPKSLVTGEDLIRFGLMPGPQIAKKLKELYRNQLLFKVTQKEELLKKLTK